MIVKKIDVIIFMRISEKQPNDVRKWNEVIKFNNLDQNVEKGDKMFY